MVMVTISATGVILQDTGASNLGIASPPAAHPRLLFFDLASWHFPRTAARNKSLKLCRDLSSSLILLWYTPKPFRVP